MGDCGPWGGAGEELLGATLFGTAGRRPNRGCGPRAAAEAARHNVTKPHQPRTYRDAGRASERASGAAGRSTRQAGASVRSQSMRMVSLVINGHHQRRWTDNAAGCCSALLQGRRRHPALSDSDEPDAVGPTLKSSEENPTPGPLQSRTPPEGRGRGGASMDAETLHTAAPDRGGTDSERVRDNSFELVC
jgi:hypothetical protein